MRHNEFGQPIGDAVQSTSAELRARPPCPSGAFLPAGGAGARPTW